MTLLSRLALQLGSQTRSKVSSVAVVMTLVTAAVSQSLLAAGLDARLNVQKVAVGDSFQLILSTQDSQASVPDLKPLEADFSVQGTSQSMQTRIINGQRSSQQSWIITLAAKQTGALTIPAISAGSVSSESTHIQVVDISEMPKAIGANGISVRVSVPAQKQHYIYQEIPLTVRIEVRQPIQQAALVAPQGADFELTQVGEDRVQHLQGLNVIERDYVLRPQTSGELTLSPFVLKGEVADSRQSRSPFMGFPFDRDAMLQQFGFGSMSSQGKPFKVRSDSLTLQVTGNPNATQDSWFLPAKAVHIEARWQPVSPVFRVGEAVTRKISLLALGARPEQLPDLNIGKADNVKMYLDDTQVDQLQTAEGTVARRGVLVSVVPTAVGEITLPEIRVSWLDTGSNEQKEAVLPAMIVKVEGIGADQSGIQSAVAGTLNKQDELLQQEAANIDSAGSGTAEDGILKLLKDQRYEAAGLAVLLLLTLGIIWQRKRSARQEPLSAVLQADNKVAFHRKETSGATEDKEAQQLKLLRNAIRKGDNSKIYHALLSWMRWRKQPVMNSALNDEISALEAHIFAAGNQQVKPYEVNRLSEVLDSIYSESKAAHAKLPPLYPEKVSHTH